MNIEKDSFITIMPRNHALYAKFQKKKNIFMTDHVYFLLQFTVHCKFDYLNTFLYYPTLRLLKILST